MLIGVPDEVINYVVVLVGFGMLVVALHPVIDVYFRLKRREAEREQEWSRIHRDLQSGDPERIKIGQRAFMDLLEKGPPL